MIKQEDTFKIGYISKFRGICGEMELTFTDDAFDRGDAEYLLFQLDGLLVPFFWEEYKFKNNDVAIFKFEGIETDMEAKKFVGTSVYYPTNCLPDEEEGELSSWKALTGFEVEDIHAGQLGCVEYVDASSANILLSISTLDGKELLIPFHDDFLVDYDLKQRILRLELPEGLLHLN